MSHEEEREDSAEEIARHRKIKDKMDKFMADITSDLLTDEEYILDKKKISSFLQQKNIPFSISYVKSFKEGFEFAVGVTLEDKNFAMMLMACLNKVVGEMQLDMDLKVSKSVDSKGK